MDPSPIEPATVSLVLSYLVPLDAPLPPHLISRPLLQRHHFLALTIDNPREYLAWPADIDNNAHDADAVAQLLSGEAQLRNPHDLSLNVRYSADEDSLQAHVQIITDSADGEIHRDPGRQSGIEGAPAPAFRLIFQWDPTDGWQYHNTALMPFPRDSYPTISDAYAAFRSPNDFLAEPNYPAVAVASADDDDDSYWDSYGQELDDGADDPGAKHAKAHPDPNSEDAYWARYSSIHGSADSTIPSPMPVKRNPDGTQTHAGVDRIFIPSSDLVPGLPKDEPYNPLEPPSPEALHERLVNLPTRFQSPPFEDGDSSDSEDGVSPVDTRQSLLEPEFSTPPDAPEPNAAEEEEGPLSTTASQQPVPVDEPQLERLDPSDASPSTITPSGEVDNALQQSIQGLYRLWKLQQGTRSPVTQPDVLSDDKEAFLTLVRRAIEEPQLTVPAT